MNYILIIIVSQTPTEFLIVHLGFVFTDAPTSRDLVRVGELELPAVAGPADEVLARLVCQLLQEELPQLDGAASCNTQMGHT